MNKIVIMSFNKLKSIFSFLIIGAFIMSSCGDDDSVSISGETGSEVTFDLGSVTSGGNAGTATFAELEDGSTKVTVMIAGAAGGHPMHIHENTAAEGGDIAITLNDVDASGMSETIVSSTDDGSSISYNQMAEFDGYINVHQSADDLATLIAQGDVGVNVLTGTSVTANLGEADEPGVSGTATFSERVSGETLIVLSLQNTSEGDSHPSHIHFNSAAEGGDIAITLSSVNGASGMSKTNVSAQDDGTSISYNQLVEFDGYINVHKSADDLATLSAQGDIGVNVLTGVSTEYDLVEKDVDGISGTATLHQRVSGEALLEMNLANTSDGDSHPAHIHMNSAAEGGGILITLTSVNGASGVSNTHIGSQDDGTAITYEQLAEIDGYINIHQSADDLATLVAQGDIGINVLTGISESFDLSEKDVVGIAGTATFHERVSGEALLVMELANTIDGESHPAHIHMNSAAEGGGILVTLTSVSGASGMSQTHIAEQDDGTALTYEQLIEIDGYINVHSSAADLSTLVAQGDIGVNALTGTSVSYDLNEVDVTGVSGTAVFKERVSGEALLVITLVGTTAGETHPSHIHVNSAAEGGAIAITLSDVNGTTGVSLTHIAEQDDESAITYSQLTEFDGYINVHNSANDLATLVAQGNIGANASM